MNLKTAQRFQAKLNALGGRYGVGWYDGTYELRNLKDPGPRESCVTRTIKDAEALVKKLKTEA